MSGARPLIAASMEIHGPYGNGFLDHDRRPTWVHDNPDLIDTEKRAEVGGIVEHVNRVFDETTEAVSVYKGEQSYRKPRSIEVAALAAFPSGGSVRVARVARSQFQIEWVMETLAKPEGSEEIVAIGGLVVASRELCLRFHNNDMWRDAFDD